MSALTVASIQLSVAAITDVGLKRAVNEDSFMADGPAFVVADGMGGYERGEVASAAVIEAFRERLAGNHFGEFADVHAALLDADDRVAKIAEGTTRGAGSTATGAVLVEYEG
ncbi:MAG: serine/threonine-protein phosphatase, partial [Demequinaceae bacterium]|nr:serine/threonine-protein phosphatase [Demequinaceae bacterium]